jgi:hypothetical protein
MEFIYTDHIDINLKELKPLLLDIQKEILKKLANIKQNSKFGTGSEITNYFNFYNLADRNEPLLLELFSKIKEKINKKWEQTRQMSIHAWLNVHRKDENLHWHGHNRYMKEPCVHGYFCIEVEPSQTIYVFSGQDDIIEINNKNNCLVTSYCKNRFLHKVTKWERDDCERITIGFNMVPLMRTRENPVPDSQ